MVLWKLRVQTNLDDVVDNDKAADDEALANLDAVNSCVNIDRISAENVQIENCNHKEILN